MIIQEHFDVNGKDFIRTYSDDGRYVVREGIEYTEATDPAEFERVYVEGGRMTEEELNAQARDILEILLGGDING